MRSSQSRALFSFTFVSAGPGDAVSFNVPVYGSASAVVQEKRLTLDGSSGVSVWAAPVAVTAIARTVSGQLVAVEATVDRPTVAEVPSGGGGSGLPVPGSGDAGKVVTVTGGEDGFELDAPAGGASGLSAQSLVVAFDNPDLLTGIEWFTVTVDSWLVGLSTPLIALSTTTEWVADGNVAMHLVALSDGGASLDAVIGSTQPAGVDPSVGAITSPSNYFTSIGSAPVFLPAGTTIGVTADDGSGGDSGATDGVSTLLAWTTPAA